MTAIRPVLTGLLACLFACGQTDFEVASIRRSASPAAGQVNVGVHIDGARISCTYLSLKDYLRMAYKVKDYQISGPDWLASERFDISATLPSGATREQVPEMLKALLAERFQMKLHLDTKDFPVCGLTVAKGGLKMKENPETDNAAPGKAPLNVTASGGRGGTSVNFGNGSSFSVANNRFEATKLNMVNLADTLARFVDRPVVDRTELKGNYDFTLEFSPEDFRAMIVRSAIAAGVALPPEAMRALDGSSGDSLLSALQSLGLKLEPRKAPLEVLVVDHVEKSPSEN